MVMAIKQSQSTDRGWICSALVGLLLALTTWTSASPSNPSGAGIHVAVHDGEISVNLRAAQIREVLAVIGQQAGLRVYFDEAANGIVDAQFSGMALDQGLRRLLRAASLSYTLLYSRGPTAAVILQEVRVFSATRDESTPNHDRARIGRGQRASALLGAISQDENTEPEPAEPDEEAESDPAELEQEIDAVQD
jgi:type II secretory pathway component GspD/PulD (secretin)